jgi:DNA-binding protein HU-beta
VNKQDLVSAIADLSGFSKTDANKALNSVIEAITNSLEAGEVVRLVGFGTFSVQERAESTGRNPRTSEQITIPAARLPKFKAGQGLRDRLASK